MWFCLKIDGILFYIKSKTNKMCLHLLDLVDLKMCHISKQLNYKQIKHIGLNINQIKYFYSILRMNNMITTTIQIILVWKHINMKINSSYQIKQLKGII